MNRPIRSRLFLETAGLLTSGWWLGLIVGLLAPGVPVLRHNLMLAREIALSRTAERMGPELARWVNAEPLLVGALAAAFLSFATGVIPALVFRRAKWGRWLGGAVAALVLVHGFLWLQSATGIVFGPGLHKGAAIALVMTSLSSGVGISWLFGRGFGPDRFAGLVWVGMVGATLGSIGLAARLPQPLRNAGVAGAPVWVIGIDGVGWELFGDLLDGGHVPNLESLVSRGSASPLASIHPALSPPVWTTIATGKRPWQHGIGGFVFEGDEAVPAHAGYRNARPLWELAAAAGRRSISVNWYVSWPAPEASMAPHEDSPILVTDRFLFSELPRRVSPHARSAEIDSVVAAHRGAVDSLLVSVAGPEPNARTHPVVHRAWQHIRRELERDWLSTRVTLHLLRAGGGADLGMLYLRGTDGSQHRFWAEHVGAQGPYASQVAYRLGGHDLGESAYGELVRAYYRLVDSWVGELLEVLPVDARVLVVSDHGVGVRLGDPGRAQLDPLLVRLGKTPGEGWPRMRDHTPPRRGEEDVRWVRLESGAGGDGLQRAAELLRGLRTTDGDTVFTEIWTHDTDATLGVRVARGLPGGASVVLPAGGKIPVKQFAAVAIEGDFTGSHRMDGLVIAGGWTERAPAGPSVLDITPTVLDLLGIPIGLDMEGRRWTRECPLDPVPTHESPLRGEERSVPHSTSRAADEAIREDLRSLGYLD